jgi:galactose mutarotase-like enzyme
LTTTLSNSNLSATINHLGAELSSLQNNHNKEYIWEGNPDFWGKHSPILFPIVGTLKDNSYTYNGEKFTLSRHGFAREMEFELIDKKEHSATFKIQHSESTLKVYPFEFELQLIYTLQENSLHLDYKVVNIGKSQMPFSIGGHPAFALPGNFEAYAIAFDKEESLEYSLLEDDLISNKTKKLKVQNKQIPLTYSLFENDALIFKSLKSKSVTLLENQNPVLKLRFDDFPSLGIWTKINAPFLCIEPWLGYSDTKDNSGNILEKEGIQLLQANNTFTSRFSIEIL